MEKTPTQIDRELSKAFGERLKGNNALGLNAEIQDLQTIRRKGLLSLPSISKRTRRLHVSQLGR